MIEHKAEPPRWLVTTFTHGLYETLEIHEHPAAYLDRRQSAVLLFALEIGPEVKLHEWEGSGLRAMRTGARSWKPGLP